MLQWFVALVLTTALIIMACRVLKPKNSIAYWSRKDLKKTKLTLESKTLHFFSCKIIDSWNFPCPSRGFNVQKIQTLIKKSNRFFLHEAMLDMRQYQENFKQKSLVNPILSSTIRQVSKDFLKDWELSKGLGI